MANTYTTRLNLTKPEVGADTNAWGGHLNANLDTIDSNIVSLSIATTQTMTGALALPSNGLNVGSGQLNVTGGNVSMSGNASAVNGTFSGTLAVTGASTLTGNTSVGGTLGVTGAATLSSTLSVTGATTLASNGLNVGSGQLQVTGGNVNMSGALTVTGACASGNKTVNGTLNVTGTTTLASNGLNVGSGQLQVVGGNVTTSGNITSSGNLSGVNGSLSGTLGVTDAATFSSTMSIAGLVTASTAPTLGGHLTNKTYVDGQDALKLNLTGGTMTGNIVFAGSQPTATTTTAAIVQLTDSIASTSVTTAATPNSVKTAYDLANAALPKAGGTMTGALALPANGLNVGSGQLNVTGGNVSASGNISGVNGSFSGTLGVIGAATFSSTLTASTAPTLGGHLTNKTYVDGQVSSKLDISGGTMTGALTLAADPVASLQPVTRQFFYARSVSTGTGLTGGGDLSTNRTISISSGGVSSTELASNAVTTVKITDANVTAAKLSGAQTGSAPIFGVRAWGYITNNGTATLVAGGNITSISRNATGFIQVNFTTALPNANYAVVMNLDQGSGNIYTRVNSKTTTICYLETLNSSGGSTDASFSFIIVG
jgi:hypothetical protein